MRLLMAIKQVLSYTAAFLVAAVGLVPLIYFVSIEAGLAQAAGPGDDDTTSVAVGGEGLDRFIANDAFGVGEKLAFDINYGFINAGSATMEVARIIEYEGRPCYQMVTRAQSNKFFSSFYRVDDRVESIIDALGLFPWRFEKNLREGGYSSDRMYTFDNENKKVVYKDDTLDVPPYVQDALSVLYFVRTQPLEVGKSVFVDNFTDGTLYPLEVRVLRRETIDVEAGRFDCMVVEPLLRSVGVFKHQGQLTVWLTDDRLRMPVLMKSKVVVGSISAELTDYELGDITVF
jgi:hypothetical protein